MAGKQKHLTENDVFLFIPNLIGYVRIILALAALLIGCAWPSLWWLVVVFYGSSQLLDAVDGWAARKFNQATQFGATLDQVTDRLSTLGVFMLNSIYYSKSYFPVFLIVALCDIGGHWVHFFSSVIAGAKTHKEVPSSWPVLKFYYENRKVMFICHGANEIFWITLFCRQCVLQQQAQYAFPNLIFLFNCFLISALPLCILKNWTNVSQMMLGAKVLAAMDVKLRS